MFDRERKRSTRRLLSPSRPKSNVITTGLRKKNWSCWVSVSVGVRLSLSDDSPARESSSRENGNDWMLTLTPFAAAITSATTEGIDAPFFQQRFTVSQAGEITTPENPDPSEPARRRSEWPKQRASRELGIGGSFVLGSGSAMACADSCGRRLC
ncbi:hypothetical protein BJ742DRAFT_792390 [Cladochytrium replicatum]|nr:hypothetical protein BJ742DRAFT_792390 [Cladochytrium replicatum]